MRADPLVLRVSARQDLLDEDVSFDVRVEQIEDRTTKETSYRARSDAHGLQGGRANTALGAVDHLLSLAGLVDPHIRDVTRQIGTQDPSGTRREMRVMIQQWINPNYSRARAIGPNSIRRLDPGARLALHWCDEPVTDKGALRTLRERSIHLNVAGVTFQDVIKQRPDGSWPRGTGTLQAILDCSEPAPVQDFNDFALLHDINGPTALLALRRLFDDSGEYPAQRQSLLWYTEQGWAPMAHGFGAEPQRDVEVHAEDPRLPQPPTDNEGPTL